MQDTPPLAPRQSDTPAEAAPPPLETTARAVGAETAPLSGPEPQLQTDLSPVPRDVEPPTETDRGTDKDADTGADCAPAGPDLAQAAWPTDGLLHVGADAAGSLEDLSPDTSQEASEARAQADMVEALSAPGAFGRLLASGGRQRRRAMERRGEWTRKRKLAWLLGSEVRRIVEDMALRQELLVTVWSKARSRQPLLHLLRNRYEELSPEDLLRLPIECLKRLEAFYRQLDECRLYLQTTEDQPAALSSTYEFYRRSLERESEVLLQSLDELSAEPDRAGAKAHTPGALLDL